MLLCQLLRSFERYCPDQTLYVCDYGLTDPQAAFLRNMGILLPRPRTLAKNLHPFALKSSLAAYAAPLAVETLVWIDSDCLILGDVTKRLTQLVAQHHSTSEFVSLAPDSSLFQFVQRWHPLPFESRLSAMNIDLSLPYYNVGVMVLRGEDFLRRWQELTLELGEHVCFEQNALNLMIYGGEVKCIEFSDERLNLHNAALNDVSVRESRGDSVFVYDGDEVLVAHITSSVSGVFEGRDTILSYNGRTWKGFMRLLHNPILGQLQTAIMKSFFQSHFAELAERDILH